MQAFQPLAIRAVRQAQPAALLARSAAVPFSGSSSVLQHRSYATSPADMEALQKKQLRMAEKAGRMKQNMGSMTTIPIIANHVPPVQGRQLPSGSGVKLRLKYMWFDLSNQGMSLWVQRRWKKLLGKDWFKSFEERALATYQVTNQALATGNYERARPFVASVVLDSLKAQRTGKLQGLRMSWKLHKVVKQSVVCAREQELFKKDEPVGQLAVRFVTEQSLEIRDARGRLVGTGSHEAPEEVTEYLIFQRDMWRPDDEWTCVKKGAKETDTLANPADQP
ncbi:uncharacterized protein JCM15063_003857 [Sporobolomyces koalae]|uniref:uncharacterized protein n=1 Tax=Sporobolomyces koalae TaxID=500713 RepID=UPI00317F90BA